MLTRTDLNFWQNPRDRLREKVGYRPTGELDSVDTEVDDFDPVFVIPVLVEVGLTVVRQDLVDDNLSRQPIRRTQNDEGDATPFQDLSAGRTRGIASFDLTLQQERSQVSLRKLGTFSLLRVTLPR